MKSIISHSLQYCERKKSGEQNLNFKNSHYKKKKSKMKVGNLNGTMCVKTGSRKKVNYEKVVIQRVVNILQE